MNEYQKTLRSKLVNLAVLTIALLFCLTLFGQAAMADSGWGQGQKKQINNPNTGVDDNGWGKMKQTNKPIGQHDISSPITNNPHVGVDDTGWGKMKQTNKPIGQHETPLPIWDYLLLLIH